MTTHLDEGTVPAAVPADQHLRDALEAATYDKSFCCLKERTQEAIRAALATSAPPPVEARQQYVNRMRGLDAYLRAEAARLPNGEDKRTLMKWAEEVLDARLAATHPKAPPPVEAREPIDMMLYCPNCGMQHIDAPESHPRAHSSGSSHRDYWTNPPHRSHLCHGCGCIWRPADVPTNGVAELKTQGKADTWPAAHNEEVRAMAATHPKEPT